MSCAGARAQAAGAGDMHVEETCSTSVDLIRFSHVSSKNSLETDDQSVCVRVPQALDPHCGRFIWPASRLMASYLWQRGVPLVKRKVIEIGAGVALPGLLAAIMGAEVTITDAPEFTEVLRNCDMSCRLNNVHCKVGGLRWGVVPVCCAVISQHDQFDYIIGSDVFYDGQDYDDILATVRYLLEFHGTPKSVFVTTYQERGTNPPLHLLLRKWGMSGESVRLPSDIEVPSCLSISSEKPAVPPWAHYARPSDVVLQAAPNLSAPILTQPEETISNGAGSEPSCGHVTGPGHKRARSSLAVPVAKQGVANDMSLNSTASELNEVPAVSGIALEVVHITLLRLNEC